jgi:hypothetical protein
MAPDRRNVSTIRSLCSVFVGQLFDVAPQDDAIHRKPDLPRDGARGDGMIAGQHEHADARVHRHLDRRGGFRPERVRHPHEGEQREVSLQCLQWLGIGESPPGERQYAHSALRHLRRHVQDTAPILFGKRARPSSLPDGGAQRDHDFGSALHVSDPRAGLAAHNRHPRAASFERDFEFARRSAPFVVG